VQAAKMVYESNHFTENDDKILKFSTPLNTLVTDTVFNSGLQEEEEIDIPSVSSISSDGEEGDGGLSASESSQVPFTDPPATLASCNQRSLFSEYWKGNNFPARASRQTSIPPQHSTLPKCVCRHPYFQLYSHQLQENAEREEDVSVNTYERTLKKCEINKEQNREQVRKQWFPYENRPLSFWWTSEPTLTEPSPTLPPRPSHSDNALNCKSQRPKPLLRKGRFSYGENNTDTMEKNNRVSFQPIIQVHRFQSPLDQWAPRGWSSWFGV
jgi:hypothetical protein